MNGSRERASRPSAATASTSAIRMASGRAPGAYEEVAGVERVIGAGVVRAVAGVETGVEGGGAGARAGVDGAMAGVRAGVGGKALGVIKSIGRAPESETETEEGTKAGHDAAIKTEVEDIEAGRRAGVKTRGAATNRGGKAPDDEEEAGPGATAGRDARRASRASTRRCRSSLRRWEVSSSLSRLRIGAGIVGVAIAAGSRSRSRREGYWSLKTR